MATDVASRHDEVVDYLAAQGGSVNASQGRSPTRAMAEALGWSLSQLSAALSELEADGRVVREVRNRRTYRVGLTASPAATDEPAETAAPAAVVSAVPPAPSAEAPAKKGRLSRLRRGSDSPSPAVADGAATSIEAAAAAEMAAVSAPPSWSPSAPTEVAPDAKPGKKRRKDKAPKAEKSSKPEKESKAEKASKPEKAPKKPKAEKAKPVPAVRSSTGFSYEIRDMPNRWLEPMGETVLARYPTSRAAFDELRRLNRKGGPFVPRVIVRIAPDGTQEIAIPGE